MLRDAKDTGGTDPVGLSRIINAEIAEVAEVHGDGLDRRGAALCAAGAETVTVSLAAL